MHIATKLLLLLLTIGTTATSASAAQIRDRLYSAKEWRDACNRFETQNTRIRCMTELHKPMFHGRSLGNFQLVEPASPEKLQSRSGIYFSPSLNARILQVREDTGAKTRLDLENDTHCQAYSSLPDLIDTSERGPGVKRLVHAWIQEYTDDRYAVQGLKLTRQAIRPKLAFHAITERRRVVTGEYRPDGRNNAGIFATCDYPSDSEEARLTAESFFQSLEGSARRFI